MTDGRIRCYSELKKLKTFDERYEYLRLSGTVGYETFGSERILNQAFYHSPEWRRIRKEVIARDLGCDLGIRGRELEYGLHIHHMNPVDAKDILDRSEYLMNPEYLICVSDRTHRAIHYSDHDGIIRDPVSRKPGDTCPWRNTEKGGSK